MDDDSDYDDPSWQPDTHQEQEDGHPSQPEDTSISQEDSRTAAMLNRASLRNLNDSASQQRGSTDATTTTPKTAQRRKHESSSDSSSPNGATYGTTKKPFDEFYTEDGQHKPMTSKKRKQDKKRRIAENTFTDPATVTSKQNTANPQAQENLGDSGLGETPDEPDTRCEECKENDLQCDSTGALKCANCKRRNVKCSHGRQPKKLADNRCDRCRKEKIQTARCTSAGGTKACGPCIHNQARCTFSAGEYQGKSFDVASTKRAPKQGSLPQQAPPPQQAKQASRPQRAPGPDNRCDRCKSLQLAKNKCTSANGTKACGPCRVNEQPCSFSTGDYEGTSFDATPVPKAGKKRKNSQAVPSEPEERLPGDDRCDRCFQLKLPKANCTCAAGTGRCAPCTTARVPCDFSAGQYKGLHFDAPVKKSCDQCISRGLECNSFEGKKCEACIRAATKCSLSDKQDGSWNEICDQCKDDGTVTVARECRSDHGERCCDKCAEKGIECHWSTGPYQGRTYDPPAVNRPDDPPQPNVCCEGCAKDNMPCNSQGYGGCLRCRQEEIDCIITAVDGIRRTFPPPAKARASMIDEIIRLEWVSKDFNGIGLDEFRKELKKLDTQGLMNRRSALIAVETGIKDNVTQSVPQPYLIKSTDDELPYYEGMSRPRLQALASRRGFTRAEAGKERKDVLIEWLRSKDENLDFTMTPPKWNTSTPGVTEFAQPPLTFAEYLRHQEPGWSGFVMEDDLKWRDRLRLPDTSLQVVSPFGAIEVPLHPSGRPNYDGFDGDELLFFAFNRGLHNRLPKDNPLRKTNRTCIRRYLEEQDRSEALLVAALRRSQQSDLPLNTMGDESILVSLRQVIDERGFMPQPTSAEGYRCASTAVANAYNSVTASEAAETGEDLSQRLSSDIVQGQLFVSMDPENPRYGMPIPEYIRYLDERNVPEENRQEESFVYSHWSDDQMLAALTLLTPFVGASYRLGIVLQQHRRAEGLVAASAYILGGSDDIDAPVIWVTNDGWAQTVNPEPESSGEGPQVSHWESYGPGENKHGRDLVSRWGFEEEPYEYRCAPAIFPHLRPYAAVIDMVPSTGQQGGDGEADEDMNESEDRSGREHLIRCVSCNTAFNYTDNLWGHLREAHPENYLSSFVDNAYVPIDGEDSEGEEDLENEDYEPVEDVGDEMVEWYKNHRDPWAIGVKLRVASRACIPCRDIQTKEHRWDERSPCSNCQRHGVNCYYPDYNKPQAKSIFKPANQLTADDILPHITVDWEWDSQDVQRGKGGREDPEPESEYYLAAVIGRLSSGDIIHLDRLLDGAPMIARKQRAFLRQPAGHNQGPDAQEPQMIRRNIYVGFARNGARPLPTTLNAALNGFPSLQNWVPLWHPSFPNSILRPNNPNPPQEVQIILRGVAGCTVDIGGFGNYDQGFFGMVWNENQNLARSVYLFFYLQPHVVDGTVADSITPGTDYTRDPQYFHGFRRKCFGKFNLKALIDRNNYNLAVAAANAHGQPLPPQPIPLGLDPVYDDAARNDLALRLMRDEQNFRIPNLDDHTVPTMALMRARNKWRNAT